jgi:hypothetical protein
MPELTITSSNVRSIVDSNTFIMGNPMPESTLTLCQSRLYPPVRDFGFGLRVKELESIAKVLEPPISMYKLYKQLSIMQCARVLHT